MCICICRYFIDTSLYITFVYKDVENGDAATQGVQRLAYAETPKDQEREGERQRARERESGGERREEIQSVCGIFC